ncbi:hypothetical protein HDU76_002511, partial [Blyttiomyces sp. JEL0837]
MATTAGKKNISHLLEFIQDEATVHLQTPALIQILSTGDLLQSLPREDLIPWGAR